MGTTNSNFLPNSTGQDLGSSSQRWDAFLQDVNISGSAGSVAFDDITVRSLNNIVFADQFSGIDIGAQINAAYAALPATGGTIVVPAKSDGTSYQFSTPILLNTPNKYAILQGGAPATASTSDPGGATLYYLPTSATTAITLDWTPAAGGEFTPGAGLRDITLINNTSPVNGGSGSLASGVVIGGTNGGAHCCEFRNVKIDGFGIAIHMADATGSSWGMVFTDLTISHNDIGYQQDHALELVSFYNPKLLLNGRGVKILAGSGDINFFSGSIDSNTVAGVDTTTSTAALFFYGTHWENFNLPGNVLYIIGGSANVNIQGGIALDDNTTGNSTPWFAASTFYVAGLTVFSGGAGLTGTLFDVASQAYISVFDNSTTPIPLTSIAFAGSGTYVEAISPGNPARIISNATALFGALSASTLNLTGKITTYNSVATVSNGIPAVVATVDLTGQNAAIGTTTLYAVPASGAGQYRLIWDAKVTTADAVSSTLGAFTATHTDPDNQIIVVNGAAQTNVGTVATTNTGNNPNSTGSLMGLPLLLNCKASTNIQYAMAYVSNTPGSMEYNLHAKLEYLG